MRLLSNSKHIHFIIICKLFVQYTVLMSALVAFSTKENVLCVSLYYIILYKSLYSIYILYIIYKQNSKYYSFTYCIFHNFIFKISYTCN